MPIRSLKELLHPKIVCAIDTSDHQMAAVTLKEDNPATKLQPINLLIPTHNCVVFQLDMPRNRHFKFKSNFLDGEKKGIHQGCDYVVACLYQDRIQFVLIELKSDCPSGSATQLWHTTPFVKYLIELLKTHYEVESTGYQVDLRYLRFSTSKTDVNKMTTRFRPQSKVDPRGFTIFIGGSPRSFHLVNLLKAA
jgi:hypothetical protein